MIQIRCIIIILKVSRLKVKVCDVLQDFINLINVDVDVKVHLVSLF